MELLFYCSCARNNTKTKLRWPGIAYAYLRLSPGVLLLIYLLTYLLNFFQHYDGEVDVIV